MDESSMRRCRTSKTIKEHLFQKSQLSPFGRAVIAIWPDNAPKELAHRAGITIRNANQIIRGERRVSARALLVINQEMLTWQILTPRSAPLSPKRE